MVNCRMGPLTQLLYFVLEVDPVIDEAIAEHSTSCQEGTVGIQRFKAPFRDAGTVFLDF